MNKNKVLTQEEMDKILAVDGQFQFYESSPFSRISDPKDSIFFAVHWHQPTILCNTGTAYVCTRGKPLKFYVYSITHESDSGNSTIHINEIKKRKIGYHHTNKLPLVIESAAPKWVRDEVDKIKDVSGN